MSRSDSDASPALPPTGASLAWLSVGAPDSPAALLRCLDAAEAPGSPMALGDDLWAAPAAERSASMRWHPPLGPPLPSLSVHERARMHISLAPGAAVLDAPGRLEVLDARRGSLLWTLDGQTGVGALVLGLGDRTRRLDLWVRARWDESPALVTGALRELSALCWSAAVRSSDGSLLVPFTLTPAARGDPAEQRPVLEFLARSPELREAIEFAARAPASTLRLGVARLSPGSPRASELIAARAMDPAEAWGSGRGLRVPQPVASRDTADARVLRALLDTLLERARRLGDDGGSLVETFASWRRDVAWIDDVSGGDGPRSPARQPVYQVFERALALLTSSRPVLDEQGAVGVAVWDSPRVYERWCALELCRALGVEDDRGVGLLRGEPTEASLAGVRVLLESQRRFPSASPLALRPDLSVSRGERRVLLDAKYRLEPVREAVGLPRDELVKMHAYRDAIPGTVGAYALFPGSEAEAVDARDARGGIGAIPMRADPDDEARGAQRERLRGLLGALLG